MIRVISSPSISTTGLVTLIFAIELRSRWSASDCRFGLAVIRRPPERRHPGSCGGLYSISCRAALACGLKVASRSERLRARRGEEVLGDLDRRQGRASA